MQYFLKVFLVLTFNRYNSVGEYLKNCQAKSKSGQNYHGKLHVDETSNEIKSYRKLTVFM